MIRVAALRPARLFAALLSVAGILAMPVAPAHAKKYPEPSVYPLPSAWYLSFKHNIPKRIVVDVPGDKVPTAYWYLTYTVTNNTGNEVDYLPDFEMVTQDGKVRHADQTIALPVFNAIKKKEGNDLILSANTIAGPLHQGEDQAKDGVAIWEEPMARMGGFSIYAGGLNSEFVRMQTEDGKPMLDADGKQITLRKQLEMNYIIFGDEVKADKDEIHDKPERWVMR